MGNKLMCKNKKHSHDESLIDEFDPQLKDEFDPQLKDELMEFFEKFHNTSKVFFQLSVCCNEDFNFMSDILHYCDNTNLQINSLIYNFDVGKKCKDLHTLELETFSCPEIIQVFQTFVKQYKEIVDEFKSFDLTKYPMYADRLYTLIQKFETTLNMLKTIERNS